MSRAFEVTEDDIRVVAIAHDTQLTDTQLEEVMETLDFGLIEDAALSAEGETQLSAALREIETQMILEGLYIAEPYRFARDVPKKQFRVGLVGLALVAQVQNIEAHSAEEATVIARRQYNDHEWTYGGLFEEKEYVDVELVEEQP